AATIASIPWVTRSLVRATTPGGRNPMDDVKKTYREGEQEAKEAWRKSDGDESLADKVGNAGDEMRKDLGNTGDDIANAGDDVRTTTSAADKEAWRKSDGDESLADKGGQRRRGAPQLGPGAAASALHQRRAPATPRGLRHVWDPTWPEAGCPD